MCASCVYTLSMNDLERDAIDANYPTYSDIVRLAQRFCPMSSQLHLFIEELCILMGWPKLETFKRIFRERLDND